MNTPEGLAPEAFTVMAVPLDGLNVQLPVIVGDMACDSGGAPSLRRNVVADPLTAVSPTVPVGFAPVGIVGVPVNAEYGMPLKFAPVSVGVVVNAGIADADP